MLKERTKLESKDAEGSFSESAPPNFSNCATSVELLHFNLLFMNKCFYFILFQKIKILN